MAAVASRSWQQAVAARPGGTTPLTSLSTTTWQQQQQQQGGGRKGTSVFGLGLGLAGATALAAHKETQPAETCGIVGVVGGDDARSILLEGLTVLQNRGYDSAGMATISAENALVVTKYASAGSTHDCIDLVRENSLRHKNHNLGIAHTRWATHGGKTDLNAHPHTDSKGRVVRLCRLVGGGMRVCVWVSLLLRHPPIYPMAYPSSPGRP